MHVLLVAPGAPTGEAEYTKLVQAAAPRGVRYAVSDDVHTGAPGVRCNVAWEIALNRLVRPRAVPDMGFRALTARAAFDLVHVHAHPVRLRGVGHTPLVMSEGSSNAVYLGDYLGWDDARLARAYRRTRRLYRALGVRDRLLAMERASVVYVFSKWAREVNVRWGADPAKLDVVAPGFPTPAAVRREPAEVFTFLFVGSDFERKGGYDVVEAFGRVSGEHPHARLVLAGGDARDRNPDRLVHSWVNAQRRQAVLERLEELQRAGVAKHIGRVTASARDRLYRDADAFVMPTLAEGFGFTNVEAMSYGLPVISSRVGPIPETMSGADCSLLVPPGDTEALEAAMRALLADRDRALRMGAAGREVFLREFTLEGFRERLGVVYRRALNG